ncbi:MAG: ATP-binding protein [Ornithinimicrobium sp.]
MSGLPGSGKTTIAHALAAGLGCAVLSVDTIEAGMRRAGVGGDQPCGLAAYAVAQALADVQLRLGLPVIADAVNVAAPAREAWMELAAAREVPLVVVEVHCSDSLTHRERLESRPVELSAISWQEIERRRQQTSPWPVDTCQVDSIEPLDVVVSQVLTHLRDRRPATAR